MASSTHKSSEGAPYNDGTHGAKKADDAVPTGGTHTTSGRFLRARARAPTTAAR